jgi:hypothetical protein
MTKRKRSKHWRWKEIEKDKMKYDEKQNGKQVGDEKNSKR